MPDKNEKDSAALALQAGPAGVRVEVGGGLINALFARRIAKGNIIQAAGDRVAEKIRTGSGFDEGEKELLETVLKIQLPRLANQFAIAQRAETLLLGDGREPTGGESEPTAKMHQDWVNHFLSDAADVSDEKMQDIYARILAGEYKAPGTYSRLTLNTLRSLDADVANILASIHPYLVDEMFVLDCQMFDEFYDRRGIHYIHRVALVDAGLLNLSESTYRPREAGDPLELVYADRLLIFTPQDTSPARSMACNILSRPGRELLSIHKQPFDEEYFLGLAGYLRDSQRQAVQWRYANATELHDLDPTTIANAFAKLRGKLR